MDVPERVGPGPAPGKNSGLAGTGVGTSHFVPQPAAATRADTGTQEILSHCGFNLAFDCAALPCFLHLLVTWLPLLSSHLLLALITGFAHITAVASLVDLLLYLYTLLIFLTCSLKFSK